MDATGWTATRTGVSDEELARAYARGQGPPFEELVQRYAGPVFAFCLRMVARREDAEDLTQDVFLQLMKSLPSARTDTPIRPWIFVIARNKCLDHLKRRRPVSFSSTVRKEDDPEVDVVDAAPLPDDLAERADTRDRVQRAINTLPERFRAVVALRYSSDLSFGEIGEVLGIPENTAKTHFQRAKALLRIKLQGLR